MSVLKNGIRRILDDGATSLITKRDIAVYGRHDWPRIESDLSHWEAQGFLKIVKPLKAARDDEVVVEMLSYIDNERPWPGWPAKPPAE